MNVTLFGATGYLGSHTAEQLVKAGHTVTCLVRDNSNTKLLNSLAVKIVTIDFSNDEAIMEYLKDTVVFNCIADTRKHVSIDERRRVEVELTTRIFRLAQQARVARFVQLSTVMAYGFERPSIDIDESVHIVPKYIYNLVAKEREDSLLDQAQKGQTELVILRPSNAIGPRDTSCLPNFEKSHRAGYFPVVGRVAWEFSCIDARDLGRAMTHLLTVQIDNTEIFLVKGYDISWLMLKAGLDGLTDKGSRLIRLPKKIMLTFGWLMEGLYPFGSTPPITRFDVDAISHHGLYDDGKIRATGFKPIYRLDDSLEGYFATSKDHLSCN